MNERMGSGRVRRSSDVAPTVKLAVCKAESGDVGFDIYDPENGMSTSVTFCTGVGGGRSPRTWRAAVALYEAMLEDERETWKH